MQKTPRKQLVDMLRGLHQRKSGTSGTSGAAPPLRTSPYEDARKDMVDYERIVSGYADRVGRFLDAVRRNDRAEGKRTAALPQLILKIEGPAEGQTGARLAIENDRRARAEVTVVARPFRTRDGRVEATPRVSLQPPDLALDPGQRTVVTLHADFAGTGFPPGTPIDGEVSVEIAREPAMTIGIEVELHAP